ncbi:sensor histidine kinase [Dinghuibacter silviterrae]|uniref:Histidine kinase n=1 Tax=Dinghuibacter silviterrae TaxID=1539049 RepID=A0A4R8DGM0_9BACT|nr:sensor histidine kinase [Dinghuibacter silviterrae]TDW96607.1 histidine kinase [Dinghuibacter silviterrae]
MEYDNDRKRMRGPRAVSLFWLPLLLIYPLVNSVTLFPRDARMWIILFNINLALWPVYMLYAREAVWGHLIARRFGMFGLLSVGLFVLIHGLVLGVYALLSLAPLKEVEKAFFMYSTPTFVRESIWILINMFLSVVIALALRFVEDKESVTQAQEESFFFKLRYLRSQLNPHFLFNTLNSIYSLSLQKSDKAPEVVVRLADLMRYLIYECNEEKIPLEKEIAFIQNYIALEQIRHKADIRFSVEGDPKDVMIEPFIFLAFIENGFKHAMDNDYAEPFIYITLKIGQGRIVLNVINSTEADIESQAKRINGKGITNSKSLLDLLYPGSYELDIIQTDKEASRQSALRLQHAKERLETLYPDAYHLDIMLNKNAFTVSLILKSKVA